MPPNYSMNPSAGERERWADEQRWGSQMISKRIRDTARATVAVLFVTSACSQAVPEVIESTQELNPSKTLVATVEVVHNGLAFGAGAIFDEIHVSGMNHRPFEHGDRDGSVVFYSDSASGWGRVPRVEWLGDSRLRISIDSRVSPARRRDIVAGVSIEYDVRHKDTPQ